MSLAAPRSSVLRNALIASCLLVAVAGTAVAQTEPTCDIEGETTYFVGEPIMICAAAQGEDLDYSWDDPQGNDINSERCLSIPGGIAVPGCYLYEMTVSNQVGDFVKCDVEICIIEEPKVEGRCWLTGGGQRTVDGLGNWHSYGGNINPACSETAGDGGNWNDVNHTEGTHFQGQSLRVIRCGNVAGHPEGSESPVTPVNFIEFEGTGRIQGVGGSNQWVPVFFHGLYEDREEPGSGGQPEESYKDRYFLHVFTDDTDPAGSTVLLVDRDGNPATVDPIEVTNGNLQMHFRPCEEEQAAPAASRGALGGFTDREAVGASSLSLSAGPNPTTTGSTLRFSLPQDGNVSIRIYDIAGRELADLGTGPMAAGQHSTMWNLTDGSGNRVPRGIYFARMTFGSEVRTQHIVVAQ